MDIVAIEPFYGGSHAQLIKVLLADELVGHRLDVYTLPAKKWHWRARTSVLHFMETIPFSPIYRVLFSSSVLNLAELVALRPDLAGLWKVVYFHENQLVYPVRKHQDRDFHYGYCQITTCLVADVIVFNSYFNMESFLKNISRHLKLMPDYRPKDLEAKMRPKCRVIHFPVDFQRDKIRKNKQTEKMNMQENELADDIDLDKELPSVSGNCSCQETDNMRAVTKENHQCVNPAMGDDERIQTDQNEVNLQITTGRDSHLHIVWPHRWEHDKDPDSFFQALFQLLDEGYEFKVSVLGESYQEVPGIFDVAKSRLGSRVVAWGYQNRDTYRSILDIAHVAVSTANHEFFGVSMLEATSRGCFPLCPKRLVYPEIYPDECLYSTQAQLVKRLRNFCRRPDKIQPPKINLERFTWKALQKDFYEILKCDS